VADLALGENHSCALAKDGGVCCWGYNDEGRLGVGAAESPAAGWVQSLPKQKGKRPRKLAAGDYHTCALTEDGRVYCWGIDVSGGQDFGAHVVEGLRDAAQLWAGSQVTCVGETTGAVRCWGDNRYGQLGGAGDHVTRPRGVDAFSGARFVGASLTQVCALLDDRSVKCLGRFGVEPPGGAGPFEEISVGWNATCGVASGAVRCWRRVTDEPPFTVYDPGFGDRVSGLTTSGYRSCVLVDNEEPQCWTIYAGRTRAPQGHNLAPTADRVVAGGVHSCAVTDRLRCWGNDWAGAVTGVERTPPPTTAARPDLVEKGPDPGRDVAARYRVRPSASWKLVKGGRSGAIATSRELRLHFQSTAHGRVRLRVRARPMLPRPKKKTRFQFGRDGDKPKARLDITIAPQR